MDGVSGEADPIVVKQLEELGVSSLVFDPTGNVPAKEDFLSVMKENVDNLTGVFQ